MSCMRQLLSFVAARWTGEGLFLKGALPGGMTPRDTHRSRSMSTLVSVLQRVLVQARSVRLDLGSRKALRRLSNHELRDLGYSRGMLD